MNPLKQLEACGQSIWLDYLKRSLIESGELRTLVERDGLKGVTSNPSIFEKAIGETDEYADALKQFQALADHSISAIYEHLAIADIRAAADLLRPVYEQTQGRDGYISLECSPFLANDTGATVAEALRLWGAVGRPNLMVKVPATPAGIPAIRQLIGRGLNINITLLFSVKVYEQVVEAYISGLEDLGGQAATSPRSAASQELADWSAARLCRGGEEARVHRHRSAGDGWIEPGAGSAGRNLRRQSGWPRFHMLDSTDPAQIKAIERAVDLGKTLFIVSSKSGSTLEPNIFMEYFFDRVGAVRGKDKAGEHFVAVTDPGSSLERRAKQLHFAHIFYGAPSIGGRYSVLSKFGLVPAAAMGLDIKRLLETAQQMERACGPDVPPAENPGVQLGIAMGVAATRFGRDKVTIIASPGIADLGAWLEQLLAESTGKHGRGLIPLAEEPLTTPERYGERPVLRLSGVGRAADPSQRQAVEALEQAGHPVARISVKDIWHIGQEFFRWEIATAVAGAIIGIDPFDQPDVEASKVKTRALTEEYEKSHQPARRGSRCSARTAWPSTPIRATPPSSVGTTRCPAI